MHKPRTAKEPSCTKLGGTFFCNSWASCERALAYGSHSGEQLSLEPWVQYLHLYELRQDLEDPDMDYRLQVLGARLLEGINLLLVTAKKRQETR